MRKLFLTLLITFCYSLKAQQAVIDVAAVGAIVSTHAIQNENLEKIKKSEGKIAVLQAKIAWRQEQIRALQVKVYNARKSAMSWVTTVTGVTKSYSLASDIVSYQNKIFQVAGGNTALNVIALSLQVECAERSVILLQDIVNALLGGEIAGKPINLMDSKQRLDLIFRVNKELRLLRGIVYGIYRKVRKIKRIGIMESALQQVTGASLNRDSQAVFNAAHDLFY